MEPKQKIYKSLFANLYLKNEFAAKDIQLENPNDVFVSDDSEDIIIHYVFHNGAYGEFSMKFKKTQLVYFEAQVHSLSHISYRGVAIYNENDDMKLERIEKTVYLSKTLPVDRDRFSMIYSKNGQTYEKLELDDNNFNVEAYFKVGLLVDYFRNFKKEIIDIVDSFFVYEHDIELYGKELKEEGIKQGIDIGKKKIQKEIAKKMKDKGMSIEDIMELSGLSKDEIEQL